MDWRTRMVRCRMTLRTGILTAALVLVLGAARCELFAAILFRDSFDYADGELQVASRYLWLKHSGNSPGQFVVSRSLFIDDDGTNDYSRALGDFPPITRGAVYAAFDLNVSISDPPESTSTSTPYFMHFSEDFGGGASQIVSRLVMNPGTIADTFRLGIVRGGGSTATTTRWGENLANGLTYRVVVGYDLDAAVSTLWVNPTSLVSPHVMNATGIGLPIVGLNWIAFRIDGTSGRSGDKTIDNLVVATSLSDLFIVSNPTIPGDFDADGNVDGADFVAWQINFPAAGGLTGASGDADHDGDVDGADFVAWQTSFVSAADFPATSVPEPTEIEYCVLAFFAMLFRQHSRSKICRVAKGS
ncbi:MAG: hypothetical protein IT427_13755 [Pirellulales bacterium]|nr:hypothetical protein [Pirellulales bacterium]